MKNCLAFFLIVLLHQYACAQATRQSVLNTGGGSAQMGYYHLEWSIGEAPLINQLDATNENLSFTNGFLQPFLLFPGNNPTGEQFHLSEIRLFPNPARSYVEVNLFTRQKGKLFIHVYNPLGQRLISRELFCYCIDILERISVQHLAQGLYTLQIELIADPGNESKKSSYKILRLK